MRLTLDRPAPLDPKYNFGLRAAASTDVWADLFDAPRVDIESAYRLLVECLSPSDRVDLARRLLADALSPGAIAPGSSRLPKED